MPDKVAFVFDTIQHDELDNGRLLPGSRSVKLFRYLTNVVKGINPENETTLLVASPAPGKVSAKELREHAKQVQTAIKDFGATVIVNMGKSAIYSIQEWLPSDFPKTLKYQQLWGKYFPTDSKGGGSVDDGRICVFCPSPSMVWAGKQQEGGYLYLRTIQECIVGALLRTTDPIQTVSHFIDNAEQFYAAKESWLSGSKLLRKSQEAVCAVDTETTGLNIVNDKVRTVQFSFEDGVSYVVLFDILPTDDWTKLFSELRSAGYRLVLQNGKYDSKILYHNDVTLGEYEELSIAHVLVDEREGTHNLNFIGQQVLGAGKNTITKEALVGGAIDAAFIDYAGRDTDITRRAFRVLENPVKHTVAYKTLTQAAHHLSIGEAKGIKLDVDKLDSLIVEADKKLGEYTKMFEDIGLNPSSPKQVKEMLGMDEKSDKKALESLDTELANAIIDFRGLRKVKSTYLERLKASANVDGRFHPDIRLAGPVTGRTSSGSGNAPDDMLWLPINSQNIPRPAQGQQFKFVSEQLRSELRSLFIADEGRVMLGMDLAAAEMRMAANACMDPVMIDDLNRKVDTHSLLTIMAYDLPYEIDLEHPELWVPKVKKEHEFQRQATKNATFAVLYGGGISAIAAQAHCSPETAKLLRDTIYNRYKGLETWVNGIHKKVMEEGRVSTRYGRSRIFPYDTGVFDRQQQQSMLREAQNYVIQSEASDYCIMGLNKFMSNLLPWFGDIYVQNMVHDALYFSVREEDADQAKDLLVEMVQTADNLPATLFADAKYGKNWGEL